MILSQYSPGSLLQWHHNVSCLSVTEKSVFIFIYKGNMYSGTGLSYVKQVLYAIKSDDSYCIYSLFPKIYGSRLKLHLMKNELLLFIIYVYINCLLS